MAVFEIVQVEPLSGYRLHLRYADGAEREVDLSDLIGRGVFDRLADPNEFESIRITEGGDVAWDDELEMCGDTLYLRLTGKTPEEAFPALRETASHA